ncbi:oligosaccharide flippase family protein [Thalassobium sp. R2A62]|uniref:oligosaccharide flippase family protein n=1 Tax=Thalassobium sp. R2A62 TaxID=633131 RepID=UPI0001B1CA35|nr:oligosaccharide flippase family protein [Thalassobium sp. R2A62]EET47281.1 putative polysaccharide export protein [Thalassobium sp. R2A62]
MNKPVRLSAARAGSIYGVSKIASRAIDMIVLIFLSRTLEPADFGLVAQVMAILLVVEAMTEIPVGAVLLSSRRISRSMLNTGFTISLIRAGLILVAMFALSFVITYIHKDSRLLALTLVLALGPAFRSVLSPRLIVYQKSIDFSRDAKIEIFSKAVSACLAVFIAYSTQSYWAIAAVTVLSPFFMFCGSYYFAPYSPKLTLKRWSQFGSAIGWISFAQLISALNTQLSKILLTTYLPTSTFGKFSLAQDISAIPHQAIAAPFSRIFLSVLSPLPIEKVGHSYFKGLIASAYLLTPIYLILITNSEILIRVLLSEKWVSMSTYLSLWSLSMLISIPSGFLSPLAFALKKTRFITIRMAVELGVKAPLLLIGMYINGAIGVLYANLLATSIVCLWALFAAGKLTHTSFRRIFLYLLPLTSFIVLFLTLHFLGLPLLQNAGFWGVGNISLTAYSGISMTICLLLSATLWRMVGCPEGGEEFIIRKLRTLR